MPVYVFILSHFIGILGSYSILFVIISGFCLKHSRDLLIPRQEAAVFPSVPGSALLWLQPFHSSTGQPGRDSWQGFLDCMVFLYVWKCSLFP